MLSHHTTLQWSILERYYIQKQRPFGNSRLLSCKSHMLGKVITPPQHFPSEHKGNSAISVIRSHFELVPQSPAASSMQPRGGKEEFSQNEILGSQEEENHL